MYYYTQALMQVREIRRRRRPTKWPRGSVDHPRLRWSVIKLDTTVKTPLSSSRKQTRSVNGEVSSLSNELYHVHLDVHGYIRAIFSIIFLIRFQCTYRQQGRTDRWRTGATACSCCCRVPSLALYKWTCTYWASKDVIHHTLYILYTYVYVYTLQDTLRHFAASLRLDSTESSFDDPPGAASGRRILRRTCPFFHLVYHPLREHP